ncbi:uncharacterized protein RSE6_07064 [Rhynchosporium secalis]|uniref:RING-type domain-containing protein n=1 Tax=Rhynchosporium secalis TaxID=38038 RepID=A0A1E1MBX9_RHYSE|nr:uncharacterized protein RSE6_07064 [Rhynchosporium secalis]
MCRLMQLNFYHFCAHTQKVKVPSINPDCDRHVIGYDYFMNEWCPRCRWLGFLNPYKYQEFAKAVDCDGHTGKVTRTVYFDRTEFTSNTKDQLWAKRDHFIENMIPDLRRHQRLQAFFRLSDRELDAEVPARDRTYLMEVFKPRIRDDNRSPDLFGVAYKVPEDRDVCGVCQGRLTGPSAENDDRYPCFSAGSAGGVVALPCNHYFGLQCIQAWMSNPNTPNCPSCRHAYKIVRELEASELVVLPPGYEDQRLVDFIPDSDMKEMHIKLMKIYYAKILLVAPLFAPFPFMSWTNLFMLTFGANLFYRCIALVQYQPEFALRERKIQNKFALFSAVGNTMEIILASILGGSSRAFWYSLISRWFLLVIAAYVFKPLLRLIDKIERCPHLVRARVGGNLGRKLTCNAGAGNEARLAADMDN